jgi:hypothetical protein
MLSTCWLLFPRSANPIHPKPSQFGWDQGIVEARSSDAALHHSWSNSPYTAWRCVGSLSCWKQIIVPLSPNQMAMLISLYVFDRIPGSCFLTVL